MNLNFLPQRIFFALFNTVPAKRRTTLKPPDKTRRKQTRTEKQQNKQASHRNKRQRTEKRQAGLPYAQLKAGESGLRDFTLYNIRACARILYNVADVSLDADLDGLGGRVRLHAEDVCPALADVALHRVGGCGTCGIELTHKHTAESVDAAGDCRIGSDTADACRV